MTPAPQLAPGFALLVRNYRIERLHRSKQALSHTMDSAYLNLLAGWIGMLGGVLSGALIGLFFHREEWMGGYSSLRRRMTRLGHISFFGLGFLNMMFAFTVVMVEVPETLLRAASLSLILGAVTMPICCFLTAWRKPFRHLFPIPVAGVLAGIVLLLLGWGAP